MGPVSYTHLMTQRLAAIVSRFVTGSAQSFNRQTNVDLSNKYIVLDLSELKGKLLPVGMFIALDYVWDQIKADRTPVSYTHLGGEPLAAPAKKRSVRPAGGSLPAYLHHGTGHCLGALHRSHGGVHGGGGFHLRRH